MGDGTNTGNAAGGDKEKSDSSTLLLEISSLMQAHDTKKGDGDSNEMITSWFKTMVMKASSRQMTERTSCLGMQLTPKDIVAAEAAVSCLEIEFGAHTGGIQQPMSKKECIDVIGVVDSVVNQRLRHMAAAVGIMVPGDLSQAPRYLLYKQLVMKLYGTTGKVDDSAIPYDRSVTKDLPIRPMLPFCVDISMCPNIEKEKRKKVRRMHLKVVDFLCHRVGVVVMLVVLLHLRRMMLVLVVKVLVMKILEMIKRVQVKHQLVERLLLLNGTNI